MFQHRLGRDGRRRPAPSAYFLQPRKVRHPEDLTARDRTMFKSPVVPKTAISPFLPQSVVSRIRLCFDLTGHGGGRLPARLQMTTFCDVSTPAATPICSVGPQYEPLIQEREVANRFSARQRHAPTGSTEIEQEEPSTAIGPCLHQDVSRVQIIVPQPGDVDLGQESAEVPAERLPLSGIIPGPAFEILLQRQGVRAGFREQVA